MNSVGETNIKPNMSPCTVSAHSQSTYTVVTCYRAVGASGTSTQREGETGSDVSVICRERGIWTAAIYHMDQ